MWIRQIELGKDPRLKTKPHEPAARRSIANSVYSRPASANSFPRLDLCLSFLASFLFSARFTGGGAPNTARDAAFTALVTLNFFNFFFFGTISLFNHEDPGTSY